MAVEAATIDRWREQNSQNWTSDATTDMWRSERNKMMRFIETGTDLIVESIRPTAGLRILDLGSGSGEPGLTLANLVGPNGHVTLTDLSPGMLAIAQEHARTIGVTNVSFQVADAEQLPFADQAFDAVTSRLGAMYFVDTLRALRETWRVLRPGGRAAFVVWGRYDDNPVFSEMATLLRDYVDLPAPEAGAPQNTRFGELGHLSKIMREAGFTEVHEEARSLSLVWPEPRAAFLESGRKSIAEQIERIQPDRRTEFDREYASLFARFDEGDRVRVPAVMNLVSGQRQR